MKKCSMCLVVKPLSEFRADKSKPSGYKQPCKDCDNERGRLRQDARRRRPGYLAYINQQVKLWRKRHPEKYAAHVAARSRKASLKKKACENCGAIERLHMHHPDYSQPYNVITLCVNCHENVHHKEAK